MSEYILGISAFYHDAAAALLRDGYLVGAVQEERFTRRKFDPSFPDNSIRWLLEANNISLEDIRQVAFYDKPYLTFDRLLETYHELAPKGLASFMAAIPAWVGGKLFTRRLLTKSLHSIGPCRPDLFFPGHHLSHAASALYPSPFDEAAIITIDGVGEWATGTIGYGNGHSITIYKESRFPHSLGLLYASFTYYCGFKINSGEYKLMGLAAFGDRQGKQTRFFLQQIKEELIELFDDGSLFLNLDYFDYATGLKMCHDHLFERLFKVPKRKMESPITQDYCNLACAVQMVTEEAIIRQATTARELSGSENLVMAGGVALNCVANGNLLREKVFKNIWVQPAAGDAGGALGAALAVWHLHHKKKRVKPETGVDSMSGAFLGPEYGTGRILAMLEETGATYENIVDEDLLLDRVATCLNEGKIVGWFQGKMEFGPRALGNRSILADPRVFDMQKKINLKIKFREGFRPFAPAVLFDDTQQFFDLDCASPYMLFTAPVNEELRAAPPEGNRKKHDILPRLYQQRSILQSITHIDYSARVQTVHKTTNPRFYRLIQAFKNKSGIGVLINTSFNVRGEPIVCSPEDAYHCFMHTEMDLLVLGNCLVHKKSTQQEVTADFVPKGLEPVADIFCCPSCGERQTFRDATHCSNCGLTVDHDGELPLLFIDTKTAHNGVTEKIKRFYETNPFPSYDQFDDPGALIAKSKRSVFARLIDEQIPYGARVLECGCDTGQLTNFLAIANRQVVGTDISINSLRLGSEFRRKHQLNRALFLQMNLFRPCFIEESFDVVISNGVLHHTADPVGAFRTLVSLVKPGGYIVIGLYHRYGRLFTDIRRIIFSLTNGKFVSLDKNLVRESSSESKKSAWYHDQYHNPHESRHTIHEVMGWMRDNNVRFLSSIPATRMFHPLGVDEKLFHLQPRAGRVELFLKELCQITPSRERIGFFITIGRKK